MRPRPLVTALLLPAGPLTTLVAQELSTEASQAIHSASRARVRLALIAASGDEWPSPSAGHAVAV